MKAKRQIGGRYLARARGAFHGGWARPRRQVAPVANPEADGATRATWARKGGNVTAKRMLVWL